MSVLKDLEKMLAARAVEQAPAVRPVDYDELRRAEFERGRMRGRAEIRDALTYRFLDAMGYLQRRPPAAKVALRLLGEIRDIIYHE